MMMMMTFTSSATISPHDLTRLPIDRCLYNIQPDQDFSLTTPATSQRFVFMNRKISR